MKNLIIIIGETRASEVTFNNIKENLIDIIEGDLCLCIGVGSKYNYNDEFYKLAKYKFIYEEPYDYADAFDYANNIILTSTNEYYLKNQKIYNENKINIPWRKFLEIKDQFLGGIKDKYNEHPGSAGILIFYRWFLLKNLIENNLINEYDRFIITRSDYNWLLPHPKLELLDNKYIWIPNGEHYRGVTDRHVIISKEYIINYLSILDCLIVKSYDYYNKLKNHHSWNLEQIIKFHLQEEGVFDQIRFFPYIMHTIRPIGGTTRWTFGKFSKELNCYIKYLTEYNTATTNKNKFLTYKLFYFNNINYFYKCEITLINYYNFINFNYSWKDIYIIATSSYFSFKILKSFYNS